MIYSFLKKKSKELILLTIILSLFACSSNKNTPIKPNYNNYQPQPYQYPPQTPVEQGVYYQPPPPSPYGYQQPPASRYYSNPYAIQPPNQYPYYDGDQYYVPPTSYGIDSSRDQNIPSFINQKF